MASSESEVTSQVNFQHENIAELVTLADLAGIKAPGNTMTLLIEMVSMGIPPQEVYQLLRDILASRSRNKRAAAKHSTKRSHQTSAETIQENTQPQTK